MSRKPRSAKTKRKPAKRAKAARSSKPDPLDEFIAGAANALGLTVEKAWMPAVRGNLDVTLRHGTRVASFALADEAEPAPIFRT